MPTQTTTILSIAHRGARSLAPENTLIAARKALEIGADMWELDVSVTKDGELILLHDSTLERTSNVMNVFPKRYPWNVTNFTWSEIAQLDAGSWFVHTDPFGTINSGEVSRSEQAIMVGEQIPTLRDALIFTRDNNWKVNIEIKKLTTPMESFPVVENVLRLIYQLNMSEQVTISSFDFSLIEKAKMLSPSIITEAILGESQPLDIVISRRAFDGYNPHYSLINKEKVEFLKQGGFTVKPWTVNDPKMMKHFIDLQVSGIITDFPQTLRRLILEHLGD